MRVVRSALGGWRRFYGANPLHLLAVLGSFLLVAYVVSFVVADASAWLLLGWFVGAVIANDVVLFPPYALADRSLHAGRWLHRRATRDRLPRVRATNYLRVPALLSGMLAVVALPTITARGDEALRFTSGRSELGYLQHWLGIAALLFLVSAALYSIRLGGSLWRHPPRRRRELPPPEDASLDGAAPEVAE
jgi:hypothetical protein